MKRLLLTAVFIATVIEAGAQSFRVALVGDPQVDNETELEYARASIYSELKSRKDIDLAIILGDLVNENPALIAPSEASLDSLPFPWVRIQGNHDGPLHVADTFFISHNIRFILMDDIKEGFSGGLDEGQMAWLKSLMDSALPGQETVLCTHIPVSDCNNSEQILDLMAEYPEVLLVSAHTHTVLRHTINGKFEELVAGATCGTWWRGVKDRHGIPYALMNCGAPRGYFICDFEHGQEQWYSLAYKVVNDRRKRAASATLKNDTLVINVFGGSKDGKVEVKAGGKWAEIPREDIVAPEVQALIDWNNAQDRNYRKEHKDEYIPMLRRTSPHVWSAPIPEGMKEGRRIKARYNDPAMKLRLVLQPE